MVLELIVKVLLALLVVAFVGYPLLKEDWEEEEAEVPEDLQELYHRKESTYSALKELEFDFKTGKLSELDYRELDTKYRTEAIELLEAIDLLEGAEAPPPRRKARPAPAVQATGPAEAADAAGSGEEPVPATLSADPARESAAGRGQAARHSQKRRPAAHVGRGRVCPECEAENPAAARFCASCGEALPQAEAAPKRARKAAGSATLVCDECGATLRDGHRYCGGCGAEVGA